jgi:hypothetical protein
VTETVTCREPAFLVQLDTVSAFEPPFDSPPRPFNTAQDIPDHVDRAKPPTPPPEQFWDGRMSYRVETADGWEYVYRWKDDHKPPRGVTGRWVLVAGPPERSRP